MKVKKSLSKHPAFIFRECIESLKKASAGEKEITLSEELCKSAQEHSEDMAENKSMTHYGSDKSRFDARMDRYAHNGGGMSENISYGPISFDARQILLMLLIDDGVSGRGHRITLLDFKYLKVGIGYATNGSNFYATFDYAGSSVPYGQLEMPKNYLRSKCKPTSEEEKKYDLEDGYHHYNELPPSIQKQVNRLKYGTDHVVAKEKAKYRVDELKRRIEDSKKHAEKVARRQCHRGVSGKPLETKSETNDTQVITTSKWSVKDSKGNEVTITGESIYLKA